MPRRLGTRGPRALAALLACGALLSPARSTAQVPAAPDEPAPSQAPREQPTPDAGQGDDPERGGDGGRGYDPGRGDDSAHGGDAAGGGDLGRGGDAPLGGEPGRGDDSARGGDSGRGGDIVDHEAVGRLEVVAKSLSRGEVLRRSARAVTVVELEEARRSSTDLGEILARTQGVSVQRTGGLGSEQRFSLLGLENEQVRFFLDGVPLALAGYPFGIGEVPVNLIERVELYSGVVPIRFGADALGGAVQLVTRPPQPGTHAAASLQAGSFDTVRATMSGSHHDPRSGFLAQVSTFADHSENDYRVTVEVPDAMGRLKPTKVHLFHAGYRAAGVNLLTGVMGRPWADRLMLRAFTSAFERELPSDPTMTEPYGAATQDSWVAGGTLRYEHRLTSALRVDAIGGYTFGRRHLLDVTECIYDWFGRCSGERKTLGEIASATGLRARDAIYDTHSAFVRANALWELDERQHIALTLAPTYADRTGDERRPNRPGQPDLLNSERRLLSFVAGLEHHLQLLDRRLESEIFAKEYSQIASSDELTRSGERIPRQRDTHRLGAGAALRYTFIPELWAKASYEYATRLPSIDEVYGDGVLIEQNLQLSPEVSHNGNLTLASAAEAADGGGYKVEVTGFVRAIDDMIQLLSAAALTQRYSNVASARSLGVQAAGSWTSPGGYLWLAANTTYQDFRNRSRTPPEATFFGDRIPNRPYFFATGQARLQLKGVATPRDRIMLTWTTRYTHAFFRTWESLGRANTASTVPAQLVHALGLHYLVASAQGTSISAGFDILNLTDARVFDVYGAERPGRAAYFKITAEH